MLNTVSQKKPPSYSDKKSLENYITELQLWDDITDVDKKNRVGLVALSLPEDTESEHG